MNFRSLVPLCSVLIMMLQSPATHAAEPVNLATNGNFSQATNGRPSDWETAGDAAQRTRWSAERALS